MVGDAVLDLELELVAAGGLAEGWPQLGGPDLEVEAPLGHRLVLVGVAERASVGVGGEREGDEGDERQDRGAAHAFSRNEIESRFQIMEKGG